MSSIDPESNLTSDEAERLRSLEAEAERGFATYLEVGDTLAEIREARLYRHTHPTFEAYLLERWGIYLSAHPLPHTTEPPPKADPHNPARFRGHRFAALANGTLLWQLRWLLTQASGTIADATHQLEARAGEIDHTARTQLRDDVRVLDEELSVLKGWLIAPIDWDAEFERLRDGEIPPLEDEERE